VHADEAASWDNLHERFEVKRINHQEAYSLDGAHASVAPRSAFTTISRGRISSARKSPHGARITAASQTGIR
jgi:hypothetical protein